MLELCLLSLWRNELVKASLSGQSLALKLTANASSAHRLMISLLLKLFYTCIQLFKNLLIIRVFSIFLNQNTSDIVFLFFPAQQNVYEIKINTSINIHRSIRSSSLYCRETSKINLRFRLFVVPNEVLKLVDPNLREKHFRHRRVVGNIYSEWSAMFHVCDRLFQSNECI